MCGNLKELFMIEDFELVVAESTCQKRVVVCELYDDQGVLLSRQSNRCNPANGICSRLNIVQNKESYDVHSTCNWTHAEIMAIQNLPENSNPVTAILYGHDFYCGSCEEALKSIGITSLKIVK